jgi:hypothetical protein
LAEPEDLIKRILTTGVTAAIASAAAAAIASHRENGHAARPINAIAHIYDGGEPPAHDGEGGRNTLLGFGIHTAASVFWAAILELGLAAQAKPRGLPTAAVLSAVAYVVDYYVVDKRFRPGFEACLSPRAMFAVYAALAAGFALSGRKRRAPIRKRHHQRERAALPRHAREPELAAQEPRQLAADR